LSKSNDKLSIRLTQILLKLNSGEILSLDDLALEFNVSKRTIQRDINERFSYLPLIKKDGYIRIEEYCLGKLSFKDIKNFAALSGIKNLYPSLDDDFIVDLLNSKLNSTYLIKGYEHENLENKKEEFNLLNTAIILHQKLSYTYNDKNRIVEPYRLVNTAGIWYLVASENDKLKTFTITKIKNLKNTEQTFEPNKNFLKIIDENRAIWFSNEMLEVLLQVDIKVVEYFIKKQLLPYQQIIQKTKTHYVISAKVSFKEEILRIARYWIPYITILEPIGLQTKLIKQLEAYKQS